MCGIDFSREPRQRLNITALIISEMRGRRMVSDRSSLEIIFSVLEIVGRHNPGALERHIFYNTFDPSLLDRYLRFLAEKRLVRTRKIGKNLVYDVTDRGKEFLRKCRA